MSEAPSRIVKGTSLLTIAILLGIVILISLSVLLNSIVPDFAKFLLSGDAIIAYTAGGPIYETIAVILSIAADVLYIFGGIVIVFGASLVIIRFIQVKRTDPYRRSSASYFLSGYLSVGLEFFIGAEIIKTVVVRTYDEFILLILVILSRGLFSLILYLDRRWHGTTECE